VGRRRRKCWIKDAPSSPRSSSVRRVCFKVVPTSTLLATRHLQPCPCIVAFRPRRKLLRAIRHHAASPQSQAPHVPVSAKPDIPTSSGNLSLPPAGTLHARQSLRFCACHGSCSPTPCAACAPSSLRPRRKSVRRHTKPVKRNRKAGKPGDRLPQAARRGKMLGSIFIKALPAAEACVYEPPAALIAGRLERDGVLKERKAAPAHSSAARHTCWRRSRAIQKPASVSSRSSSGRTWSMSPLRLASSSTPSSPSVRSPS